MKVTLLQINSQNDKAHNMAEVERLAKEAIASDAPDLIVLPEYWAFLGGSVEQKRANAEPLPPKGSGAEGGTAYEFMRRLAREHSVFVHGGSMHERDGEQLYNTTVVFDREGNEIARYRKIHLFDVTTPDGREYKESRVVGRGDELVTYDADGVNIGASICYDIRFGELYRGLAAKGAQMIMIPAAFTLMTGKDHWEVLARARAIETETYVLACGQTGTHMDNNQQRACYGHTLVVDPWGHVIAKASDGVGWVTARIDPSYLTKVRQEIPVHQHRVL
jgi:deaminated glutathione amidase